MTKLSKHIQNKKKHREKKRAKKRTNVKAGGIGKHERKTVGALKKIIANDIGISKNAHVSSKPEDVRKSNENRVHQQVKHKRQNSHSAPVRSGTDERDDTPAKTAAKATKKHSIAVTPSPSLNAPLDTTTTAVTDETAQAGDGPKRPKPNKRWKKLKAELHEKKKRRELEHGEAQQTKDRSSDPRTGEVGDPNDDGNTGDFKSMLLSKSNAISHRREKKRKWRRLMKRLQRLKLQWAKEGKTNIEELVTEWRKQQREALDSDDDCSESKRVESAANVGGDSKSDNAVARKGGLRPSEKVDVDNKVQAVKRKTQGERYDDNDDGGDVASPPDRVGRTVKERVPIESGVTNKALQRLRVAQFRIINETLYTSKSDEAEELFKNDTSAFQIYHEGYRSQVCKWPINPLDRFIDEIKQSAPRGTSIADLGCGDAKLAKTLKPLGYKIHSFDLVATNEHVKACNMKDLPLKDGVVDMAVMCLSLMGTDMGQFVLEANRILKLGGTLKVAEVESRIPSVESFIKILKRYGFNLENQNTSHDMFVFLNFTKAKSVPKGAENNMSKPLWLKPCLYKKR